MVVVKLLVNGLGGFGVVLSEGGFRDLLKNVKFKREGL